MLPVAPAGGAAQGGRQMRYRVWGKVVGTKYLGVFDAASKQEAEDLALESNEAHVALCWKCSGECDDAEIVEASAEEVAESAESGGGYVREWRRARPRG